MLTTKEVSKSLKVSEQYVRSLIRSEQLDALQSNNQWIIQEDNLLKYLVKNNIMFEPNDHDRLNKEMPEITALSFFSGAMGLDIGMEQAGIKALLACEFNSACRMTIQANRPDIALIGDITKYSSDSILQAAKIPNGRTVDLIYGGPPCQAFSTAGKRKGFNDIRGNVFLKFLNIINDIKPRYVVIENVRGLLSASFPYSDDISTEDSFDDDLPKTKGGALLHILRSLRNSGYSVSFELYNTANFGAPQIRERVVIIGYLGNRKVPHLAPTHDEKGRYRLPRWHNLGEAIAELPIKQDQMHYVTFPEKRLKYYRMLRAGQYWRDLPLDLQKEAMGNSFALSGGKTGFYRRLSFDKPSPTLVTHPAMPATDLCHPIEDRPLSVEEYSRIQGFPNDWIICGSILDQYRQIGNAVPIEFGKAIGKTIIDHMNGIVSTKYPWYSYSRYHNTDEITWEREARKRINQLGGEQYEMSI